MSESRPLIVTHHAPDLDAIAAAWLLKKFDAQHFADAKIAFVSPGKQISLAEAEEYGSQLHEITYVDTGGGKFDHHQSEKAQQRVCATSLVYEHLCEVHPELKDDTALQNIVELTNQVDHFEEVFWPEAQSPRSLFMIQELIKGAEYTDPHNDDSQLHFGFQCLDNAYASLTQHFKALEIIRRKGREIEIQGGKALVLLTRNDDTIKVAQKQGFLLVVRKDPKLGHVRIKARPDAPFNLDELEKRILATDQKGTWFYHGSGKMLLNGSLKNPSQIPSPLTVEQLVVLIKEIYG
ncbi:MAG: hypothetical protein ABII10_00590 [Candidatus Paceibacterota bacterium]